jgi:NCS1 family nucleobase:cation symporter-1
MKIEKRGIEQVTKLERTSKPSELFWPWFAGNISVFGVSYGAYILAFDLNLLSAIIAAGIGIIGSFILVGLASLAGKRGSAPVMILNRSAFGVNGSKFTAIISWCYIVGWEIILLSTATLVMPPVISRFNKNLNTDVIKLVAVLLIAFLIIFIAFVGYKMVIRVQKTVTILATIITIIYICLSFHSIDITKVMNLNSEFSVPKFIGAIAFAFIGIGIGWINAASDFTRYQPESSSAKKIVFWTVFGGSTPVYLLLIYGLLLVGTDTSLIEKITNNPVGALTEALPTWFIIPFALLTIIGLMSGIILDIYSSGFAMISTGLKLKRYHMVLVDGAIMILGAIYIVFFAPNFMVSFQAFLSTIGVPILAWSGIFVGDSILRHKTFDSYSLYNKNGIYGSFNLYSWCIMFISSFVGFGLVKSDLPIFSFEGYIYSWLNLENTDWVKSNIGLFFSIGIAIIGTLIFDKKRVQKQELLTNLPKENI